jgi:hypothetical protein
VPPDRLAKSFVSVSNKQETDLNLPRSSARIFMAKAPSVVCLLAAVATLVVELVLDRYRPAVHWSDYAAIALAASPYFLLALVAWVAQASRPSSFVLTLATVILAVGGLSLVAMEWYGYYQAMNQSPKGAEYMSTRYQRMAIFIVPLAQWIGAVVLGIALLRVRITSRRETPRGPA